MLFTLPAVLAVLGLLPCLAGLFATRLFAAGRFVVPPRRMPSSRPPVTVMKPLCGPEPGLETALASFCEQDYPADVQIVFGVQDPADPALAVAERLRARYPDHDIAIVVDPTGHGRNRKVGNLINMLPLARHGTLVFADSDLTVGRDYLTRLQAALEAPGVGLVTTLCAAAATVPGAAPRLGATYLTHSFLPSALLSRAFGRQDCLGTTMALSRATLAQVGGLQSVADHLADDNLLGQHVRRLGLSVALADTVPVVGVHDRRLRDLWSHEMRWARTTRALAPWAYAASAIQYPIAWAMLAVLLSHGAGWAFGLLAIVWTVRALAGAGLNRALAGPVGRGLAPVPFWLLPLRDLLSLVILVDSYRSGRVMWRGHRMHAEKVAVPPFSYTPGKAVLVVD